MLQYVQLTIHLSLFRPILENSVLITYAHNPHVNTHSDVSNKATGLNFGLSLHLHPYFVKVSSEGSGKTALLL